jgi:hypothetical protein
VDVDGPEPRLLSYIETKDIYSDLLEIFNSSLNINPSSTIILIDLNMADKISRPLLAGWLLGYPVSYKSINPEYNALSMRNLSQYKIYLNDVTQTNQAIDLMIFTIPCSVLDELQANLHISQIIEHRLSELRAVASELTCGEVIIEINTIESCQVTL